MVQPGAEYEALVSEVISKFKELRDPVTGEKLFARVGRARRFIQALRMEFCSLTLS